MARPGLELTTESRTESVSYVHVTNHANKLQLGIKRGDRLYTILTRRSCDLVEILSHVSRSGPVIALTNANILACDSALNSHLASVICGVGAGTGTGAASSSVGSSSGGSRCCAKRAYQGHYILIVGG